MYTKSEAVTIAPFEDFSTLIRMKPRKLNGLRPVGMDVMCEECASENEGRICPECAPLANAMASSDRLGSTHGMLRKAMKLVFTSADERSVSLPPDGSGQSVRVSSAPQKI